MPIVLILHRNNLIAQKNNAQINQLQNSRMQRNLLNSSSSEDVFEREKELDLDSEFNNTELLAINAELNALDNANINYFA